METMNPKATSNSASGDSSSIADEDENTSLFTSDIEELLAKNMSGCDVLWSLFVAAAKSYRFSSILHPFPPMYQTSSEDEKKVLELQDAISRISKFSASPEFISSLSKDCKKLLSWVLLPNNFRLRMRDKECCFQHIKELTGQVMDTAEPNFICEVIYSAACQEKFRRLCGGKKTFYAYHGSRFDNFYSILHNGLNVHLNKVSLFGEGTYLSSELSVSLLYSPAGEGSKSSSLGGKLSCVLVCQMIDDSSVKCQVKEGSTAKQKQRAQASRSTDAVPEKYYVVQNNDMLRVKYLLLYKHETSPQQVSSMESSSYAWLRDHKFTLLMLAYVLLLVAVGLANSRQTVKAVMRFFKSIL